MAFDNLTLEEVARYGVPGSISRTAYKPGETVYILSELKDKSDLLLSEWRGITARVNESNVYTPEGKRIALGEAAAGRLKGLADIRGYVAKCRATIEAERRKLIIKRADAEPALMAVIWNTLPTNDGLQLLGVLTQAVERGDERVFTAIVSLPFYINPLSEEQRMAAEASWAEKQSPEGAQRVRDMVSAVKVVLESLDRVEKIIREDSGLKVPDEIQRIAAGGGR